MRKEGGSGVGNFHHDIIGLDDWRNHVNSRILEARGPDEQIALTTVYSLTEERLNSRILYLTGVL